MALIENHRTAVLNREREFSAWGDLLRAFAEHGRLLDALRVLRPHQSVERGRTAAMRGPRTIEGHCDCMECRQWAGIVLHALEG